MVKFSLIFTLATLCLTTAPSRANDIEERQTVLLVLGAEGAPEYGKEFKTWAEKWSVTVKKAGAKVVTIGLKAPTRKSDRAHLAEALERETRESTEPLWLVLIGHGTFDGKSAKFNLRGPDISASGLAKLLEPIRRPIAIINCASSSAPFINHLSGKDRVVLSATKSGWEYNLSRFGGFLADAIADPAADLDRDEQTSLLEAFLFASTRLAEFYREEARLATEHPLIDDNGDGLGTRGDWFRGIHATRKPRADTTLDGFRAHQLHLIRNPRERDMPPEVRARRDALELELARLREIKSTMGEEEYYRQLEVLLIDLAKIYEALEPPHEGRTSR